MTTTDTQQPDTQRSKTQVIVDKAHYRRPKEWRLGQALWNEAYEVFGAAIEHLRCTDADPFHNERNVGRFLHALQEIETAQDAEVARDSN